MKTLKKILFFLALLSPPAITQQAQQDPPDGTITNNWNWTPGSIQTLDWNKTITFIVPESGSQSFGLWGNTEKNGGWLVQGAYNKDFWATYYPNPDSFSVDIKITEKINVAELWIAIQTQDSTRVSSGWDKKVELLSTGQTIKIPGDGFVQNIGRLYINFVVIGVDSCYIGVSALFDNLIGIYADGSKIVFDSFEITDVDNMQIPTGFALEQNYPNPFNPITTIRYQLPVADQVSLKVYDLLGREVATLVNEYQPAGTHEVEFSGRDLSSGVYIYKLQSSSFSEIKKMSLIK